MYHFGSSGHRSFQRYQQYHRDAASLEAWVQGSLPSYVENVTPYVFEHRVLATTQPWLLMFHAPWCGHCTRFMPHLEDVARTLKSEAVTVGRVNCEKYGKMCNK